MSANHNATARVAEMAASGPAYLQVIAHYFAKPETADRVAELLEQLGKASRLEPDNLYYEWFRSAGNPQHFVILEKYKSADGLERHRQTGHFQKIGVGQIIPLLDRREVESYRVTQQTSN